MSAKQVQKKKKTKTFTGCATCRSRKIKCDLGKPFCKRCEKSGLICAGYQINLCWSKPIKFDKYGYQLPAGPKNNNEDDDDPDTERTFQRRNIDFVKYDKEYETYDDMDRDLGLLHSPDYSLIENQQTWLQGPFGVFEGLTNIPSDLMRKRRKLTKTKYRNTESPANTTNNNNDKIKAQQSPGLRHKISQQDVTKTNQVTGAGASTSQVQTPRHFPQSGNLFEEQNKIHLNNEWLSNELRYDAMLSAQAATFNDNFHNFDFLSPFVGGTTPAPVTNHPTPLNLNNDEVFPYDKKVFNALRSHTAVVPIDQESHVDLTTNHNHNYLNTNNTNNNHNDNNNNHNANANANRIPPPPPPQVKGHVLPNEIIISTAESNMPEEMMKIIDQPNIPQVPRTIALATTGLQISPLTRFLMNYYIDVVADLMTVVAFPKNPWKTIYFPRALRALGDISGLGKTTNARASLLNALLAVSCFNLQAKYEKGSTEMKFFLNLGIELRLQAASFLNKMLETEVPDLTHEKYKDVITAILSMNTIDIVWGTMAGCQYHISMCEGIINKRLKKRPVLSHKARLLHRIHSFLKVVQDSTNFDNLNNPDEKLKNRIQSIFIVNPSDPFTPGTNYSMNGGEFEGGTSDDGTHNMHTNNSVDVELIKSGTTKNSIHSYSPAFMNDSSTSSSKIAKELLLTDALYGLPNSLIILLGDTVNLLKTKFYLLNLVEQDSSNKNSILRKFDQFCLGFEEKLLKWENEWNLKDASTGNFLSYSHEGIHYHCMAYYNSISIYYFTMVRGLDHILLQKYSINTLDNLTSLQNLINEKKVKILPLIWPGFIAGCSAINKDLQNKFRDWAASLAKVGMGSYWGARQIMFEVWRRRESKQNDDNWLSVHRDWEMNLMLA